ncbi:ATP-binding protein [Candidatus Poribacteria bacterium]|nr:ATP-binding protein [Candidatus Poribacteria bacterium]
MGKTTEQSIRLDLPSSMQFVYVLDTIISEILREMDFDEETSEQINLAVVEAGTNAIKHGNKEDPDKRAHFEFILTPDQLTIIVQDQGDGFDREKVADPLDPANLLKSSGRGLFLMETCMDSVVYEGRGTIIKMVKYKQSADSPA